MIAYPLIFIIKKLLYGQRPKVYLAPRSLPLIILCSDNLLFSLADLFSRLLFHFRPAHPLNAAFLPLLISIFVFSKLFHIQLPPQKRQRLNTINFQGKSHDPTSIDIPRKRGKYALSFQENRVIDQWETLSPKA